MPTQYTSLLGFALPATGELDGTWGDVVNDNITELVEDAIASTATASVTSGNWTLTTTGSGAANEARSAILIPTGTPGTTRNIVAPSSSKAYIINNQSNGAVVVKGSATTGATVAAGTTALVAWNGSDFVLVAQNMGNASGVLAVVNGGTGAATLTGVLKGNGTSAVTASNVNLTSEVTGTLPVANGGSGAATLTGVLKGNGTSAFSAATAGTDFVAPGTATTFTALQTFNGSSSVAAMKLLNAKEGVTVSATAATGTINYDVTTSSIVYYTTNSSGNWTINFRGSSGTSLNSLMSIGESISVVFMSTQGGVDYYNNSVAVDGTTSGVTTKWQGGVTPTNGNTDGVDVYGYLIIKTANATFSVFASLTEF
jgi:hypothetical protein